MIDIKFDQKIQQLTEELNEVSNQTMKDKIIKCKTELQSLYTIYQQHLTHVNMIFNAISEWNENLKTKLVRDKEDLSNIKNLDNDYRLLYQGKITILKSVISAGDLVLSSVKLSEYFVQYIISEYILNLDKKTYRPEIFKEILSHIVNISLRKTTIANQKDFKILVNSSVRKLIKTKNLTADEQLNYYDNFRHNMGQSALVIQSEVKNNTTQQINLSELYKTGLK